MLCCVIYLGTRADPKATWSDLSNMAQLTGKITGVKFLPNPLTIRKHWLYIALQKIESVKSKFHYIYLRTSHSSTVKWGGDVVLCSPLGDWGQPKGHVVINFYTTAPLCTMVQRTTKDVGKIKLVCQNVCRTVKRSMLLNSR